MVNVVLLHYLSGLLLKCLRRCRGNSKLHHDMVAMDRFGRRVVLCISMFLGGLACISCMFVPEGEFGLSLGLLNQQSGFA